MNIGWPEGIYLAFVFIKLLIEAGENGKEVKRTRNFGISLLASMVWFGILYWGGFFA